MKTTGVFRNVIRKISITINKDATMQRCFFFFFLRVGSRIYSRYTVFSEMQFISGIGNQPELSSEIGTTWAELSSELGRLGPSCLLKLGQLGPSCLGPTFLWAELSWADLSLGRVVLNPVVQR